MEKLSVFALVLPGAKHFFSENCTWYRISRPKKMVLIALRKCVMRSGWEVGRKGNVFKYIDLGG